MNSTFEIVLLMVTGASLVSAGYFLGSYFTLKSKEGITDIVDRHYNDMKILVNQYSDLSMQLTNALRGTPGVGFSPPESFQASSPQEQEELTEDFDLAGGRI